MQLWEPHSEDGHAMQQQQTPPPAEVHFCRRGGVSGARPQPPCCYLSTASLSTVHLSEVLGNQRGAMRPVGVKGINSKEYWDSFKEPQEFLIPVLREGSPQCLLHLSKCELNSRLLLNRQGQKKKAEAWMWPLQCTDHTVGASPFPIQKLNLY